MRECVMPVLRKRHPELLAVPEAAVAPDAVMEIAEALTSKGYEWQDDPAWKERFAALLAA